MKAKILSVSVALGLLTLGVLNPQLVKAQESGGHEDYGKVLQVLSKSKHKLADGIRQAAKPSETPISAKFELDDNGQLSLSVYTAEKGLTSDAEHNVLKELSGSPEAAEWNPKAEVFKDVEHVARSAEQQTLMALSRFSLLDIIAKAEKQQPGTVFSITPMIRDRKPQFLALVASQGKVVELTYDLMTGNAVKAPGTQSKAKY